MTTMFDAVTGSLCAFESLPEWLAVGMDPARVSADLTGHVPELAAGTVRLLSCTPERLRAKEDEWLARYRLTVAGPGDAVRDVVLVGNLWPPSVPLPAAHRSVGGARFPEPGWGCVLPGVRLQLRVQETDEALPALGTLVEPAAAAELLQPILRAAGYAGATISSCDPEVVRYKPGSRCTVVVRLGYAEPGTGPDPVVLKTHQGDKGQTAWAAMTALWERPVAREGVVTLAEPLAYLPEERILVQGPVPEECTLKELARRAVADGGAAMLATLREELTKTARALAAVHGSGASYGRTATFEEELAEVTEVVERLSRSVPSLLEAAGPLLRRLEVASGEVLADPAVPAHHDFRPAQVLLHQGSVGFIDFDGACMAEPALDLARFRAKLRDIGISALTLDGRRPTADEVAANLALLDELCEHFLDRYLEHAPVSRARVLLWESCDLFTALLHAWTKVRLYRVGPRLTVLLHQLRAAGFDAG